MWLVKIVLVILILFFLKVAIDTFKLFSYILLLPVCYSNDAVLLSCAIVLRVILLLNNSKQSHSNF